MIYIFDLFNEMFVDGDDLLEVGPDMHAGLGQDACLKGLHHLGEAKLESHDIDARILVCVLLKNARHDLVQGAAVRRGGRPQPLFPEPPQGVPEPLHSGFVVVGGGTLLRSSPKLVRTLGSYGVMVCRNFSPVRGRLFPFF